jgi:hypothetical protein
MRLFLLIIFTLSLFGCATDQPKRVYEDVIEITEINPNRLTAVTKQNLFHLAKVYDLRPFLYTKQIHVQSYVIPHSHPTLTINTRNSDKPQKLLATWLHEEFHWWAVQKKADTEKAIAELKVLFPKLPAGGSHSDQSTYLHLLICHLEYRALVHYLGATEAKEVMDETIKKDKLYPWIYTQVLTNPEIGKIVKKHKLLPAPLT